MKEDSFFHRASGEVKREKEMTKGMTKAQKAEYFIMYHKVLILFVAIAVIVVISLAYSHAHNKGYAFQALLFNTQNADYDETYSEEFREILGINEKSGYQVVIDSSNYIEGTSQLSVAGTEKLMLEVNSRMLDVCIMPEELFDSYVEQGAFGNLEDCLSPEQLSEYCDLFIYNGDTAVGVRVDNAEKITEASLYEEDDFPVFGIIYNAPHPDESALFLDYLYGVSN